MSKEYENAKITKLKIKDTFLRQSRTLNKVSVNSIITEANINRGTFYIHYKNIKELILDIENDVTKEYKKVLQNAQNTSLTELIDVICGTAESEKEKLFAIIKTNCFQNLVIKISQLLKQYFIKFAVFETESENKLWCDFISAGVIIVLREYIISNCTIKEAKQTIRKIILKFCEGEK
jgi:AcrR family transcriptional regulator